MSRLVRIDVVRDQSRSLRTRVRATETMPSRMVANGEEVADIEVWIDTAQLVKILGSKAIGSKRRISKLQGGAITIKAVNIRHVGGAA